MTFETFVRNDDWKWLTPWAAPWQHITHPMTYPMTDPQMKTKTMNMTMDKTRVQNCDVRAVSHSCDVFLCSCLCLRIWPAERKTTSHFTKTVFVSTFTTKVIFNCWTNMRPKLKMKIKTDSAANCLVSWRPGLWGGRPWRWSRSSWHLGKPSIKKSHVSMDTFRTPLSPPPGSTDA